MLGASGKPLDLLQIIFQSMTVIKAAMDGHCTDKPPTAAGGRHAIDGWRKYFTARNLCGKETQKCSIRFVLSEESEKEDIGIGPNAVMTPIDFEERRWL